MTANPTLATGDRISLGRLLPDARGTLIMAGDVDLADYSRFKHGDWAVARTYGAALADALAAQIPMGIRRLKVTSSAFGFVPPAAQSLLNPFIERLRTITDLDVERFKVDRLTVTNGDYASMTLEERQQALGDGSLLVDPRTCMLGEHVVAVDDVRITGTHESVMDDCLVKAGAASVQHLYVVDAFKARDIPTVESGMNSASVRTVADLISIASQPTFVPNARFCKRIITLPIAEMATFVAAVPDGVTRFIADAIVSDALGQYPAYAMGASAFRALAPQHTSRTLNHNARVDGR